MILTDSCFVKKRKSMQILSFEGSVNGDQAAENIQSVFGSTLSAMGKINFVKRNF